MKNRIPIRCYSLRVFSRRIIFICAILLFACHSILQAEIQNRSFEFDGLLRNYMVYLPNNYTGDTNFPLVIHLHSGDWTAQQDMNYTKLNQVAESNGFIVVYPSAIDKRWNSGGRPAPDVDDVGFIDALIDIMSNNYSIDLERIYACGYSRGGFMAYTLACQLSHRIAAIASVSGVLSTSVAESCSPLRTMPVLHIHGTADTWVPINGASGIYSADKTLSYWISFNDCIQIDTAILPDLDPTDGCTVEKTTYTNCSDNSNVVYYKVINGGHTWPGAGPPGYAAGNTNQDFDASVEIWNFFKEHKIINNRPQAWNLIPTDGTTRVENWVTLSWGIGVGAVSHDVYFGENFDDVNNGTGGTFHGNQTETSFTVGLDGYPYLDGLPLHTTYYWRIDEVNDLDPNSPYKGFVWSFKVSEPGLVVYWKLDETEGDIACDSAAVNDGVVFGGAVWRPDSGMVGGAVELDGVDDFISAPAVLNPANGPFSVLAWVKGGGPGQVIISGLGGSDWLSLDLLTGSLMTDLKASGRGATPLLSQTVITDGSWHRIALIWDGSYRTLYVDGIAVAEDTQINLERSASGLYIGCGDPTQGETFFSGMIDDIRIYNRVIIP